MLNLISNVLSIGKGVIVKQLLNAFNLLGYLKEYGLYIGGAIVGLVLFLFMRGNQNSAAVQKNEYKEVNKEVKEGIKDIKDLTKQSDVLEVKIKDNDINIQKQTEDIKTIINTTVKNIDENKKVIEDSKVSNPDKIKNTENRIQDVINKLKEGN